MAAAQSVLLLNNIRNRDHETIYGSGAFYDLNLTGRQAEMAKNLTSGQHCIVASKPTRNKIDFDWFVFENEKILPQESGTDCRVFFGKLVRSESAAEAMALKRPEYRQFFNVNGHFKR